MLECNACNKAYHPECHQSTGGGREAYDPRRVWHCNKCRSVAPGSANSSSSSMSSSNFDVPKHKSSSSKSTSGSSSKSDRDKVRIFMKRSSSYFK